MIKNVVNMLPGHYDVFQSIDSDRIIIRNIENGKQLTIHNGTDDLTLVLKLETKNENFKKQLKDIINE